MSTDSDESEEKLVDQVEEYEEHCDTEFGPQIGHQAWSQGEPPTEPEPYVEQHRRPWWVAAAVVTVIAAVGTLAISVAFAVVGHGSDTTASGWPSGYHNPPPVTVPTADNDPVVPALWPPPAVGNAAFITQDGDYMHRLRSANLIGDQTAETVAANVRVAHNICAYLAQGWTVRQLAVWEKTSKPDEPWTEAQDEQWDRIAAAVYCPGLA